MSVRLRRYPVLGSTQDLVHELAGEGAPHGTAVVAGEQTGARGSRGRGWSSPPGGLWLSVLCRPPEAPALDVLSLRVALGVADALEREVPGLELALKWPNDLMLHHRKVGGILCEARWQGSVPGWVTVGVGINVSNPVPGGLAVQAIALRSVHAEVAADRLAEPVAEAVQQAGRMQGPLTPAELAAFARRDWLLGRRLLGPLAGIAEGLAADGALLVRQAGGVVSLRSGTVEVEGR